MSSRRTERLIETGLLPVVLAPQCVSADCVPTDALLTDSKDLSQGAAAPSARRHAVVLNFRSSDGSGESFVEAVRASGLVACVRSSLHLVRAAEGVSQAEVARRMATGQSVVSKIEGHQKQLWLSTIDRYLGALGYKAGIYIEPLD
jgi:hypothetical protein